MSTGIIWNLPYANAALTSGERRAERRYELELELRWKFLHRRRLVDAGRGKTVDLGSGGVLFDAGCDLPVGGHVELVVDWPILLHNIAPLQLLVTGRVVRSRHGRVAIRMEQHEFRTRDGSPTCYRPPAIVIPFARRTAEGMIQ